MAYQVQTYNPTPQVLYNPRFARRLYGIAVDTLTANLANIAGQQFVRAGAIICTDGKLLKRAKLLTGAAAADTGIYVNNPWAFSIGDALKVVAAPNTPAATELAAITGATGASLGTITAIDAGTMTQSSRITPSSAVVGNVITVNFKGTVATYAIASATLATELDGLAAAINNTILNRDDLRYVSATNMGTYVAISTTQQKSLVEFSATIAQGSGATLATLTTSTDSGLGKLTLSAPITAALPQGTKIGTLNQIPQGIFETDFDFTNYLQSLPVEQAVCPCYGGEFYQYALPYIDGQVTSTLLQAVFMPAYQ